MLREQKPREANILREKTRLVEAERKFLKNKFKLECKSKIEEHRQHKARHMMPTTRIRVAKETIGEGEI